MNTNSSLFASSIERAAHGTDSKSNIGIAKMSLDKAVEILGKTPANYYLLFINTLHSALQLLYFTPRSGSL